MHSAGYGYTQLQTDHKAPPVSEVNWEGWGGGGGGGGGGDGCGECGGGGGSGGVRRCSGVSQEQEGRREGRMFGESQGGLAALEAFQRDYLSPASRWDRQNMANSP